MPNTCERIRAGAWSPLDIILCREQRHYKENLGNELEHLQVYETYGDFLTLEAQRVVDFTQDLLYWKDYK